MRLLSTLLTLVILGMTVLVSSCTKENDPAAQGQFRNGLFITNEGPFMSGTGTVTFLDLDSNLVKQDIFEKVNGRPLGNIVQSMSIFNGKCYIVVNNAGKVEVVDALNFKTSGTITGLSLPRYFQGINDKKGYVSDWSGNIKVVNLATNQVMDSIPAGTGPEQMMKSGKYVYVLNGGGFGVDSTVTVIDYSTDKVVKTLHVFDRPTGIVEDGNGKIWVMCSGKGFNFWPMEGDTKGHLVQIDPLTLSIEKDIPFEDSSVHPEKLVINESKTMLFFLYNAGIYRINPAFAGASPVKLLDKSNLYALGYDPESNYLLASDPLDFQQAGWVFRFRTDDGSTVDSIRAGIVPGGFCRN